VQVQALKQAEERWGLVFPEGEPVPVPGHDWEWQIESRGIKPPLLAAPAPASSLSAENLSLPTSPVPITHLLTAETGLVSLSPAPPMMTPVCPGASCKKRVRFAAEDPETVVSMDIIQKIKDAFNRIAEREPTKDDWLDLILEINKQINMLESRRWGPFSRPVVRCSTTSSSGAAAWAKPGHRAQADAIRCITSKQSSAAHVIGARLPSPLSAHRAARREVPQP
jgi:hypothetical protein